MAARTWAFTGWYYPRNGERVGPVNTQEMIRLVGEGQLQASDDVWKGWCIGEEVTLLPSKAGVATGLSDWPTPGRNNVANPGRNLRA